MLHKTIFYIKKSSVFVGIILFVCLTSAFSFPSFQEIRQDIHKKLEYLWAKTPSAKKKMAWQTAKLKAENAVNEAAVLEDATEYASKSLSESQAMLSQADHYASTGEYYKASYLAEKAYKKAEEAKNEAQKTRTEEINQAKTQLDKIKLSIKQLDAKYKKNNSKVPYEYDEIVLAWRDLVHALDIEQLQYLPEKIAKIQKRLDNLNTKLDTSSKIHKTKKRHKKIKT